MHDRYMPSCSSRVGGQRSSPSSLGQVHRYELLVRSAASHSQKKCSKKWISLGIFAGNNDFRRDAVAKLHSYGEYQNVAGVACRYLRFRPLPAKHNGFSTWKAMSVCLHGHAIDKNGK